MYTRIESLSVDLSNSSSNELDALAKVWRERRHEMEGTGAYQEFLKRLHREWAIETGIIERLYTWDRGVTEVLIEQGIEATVIAHQGGLKREEADKISDVIRDHLEIVEGLFDFVKGGTPLTEHFIRSIQEQFTAHQLTTEAVTLDNRVVQVPMLRGEYKRLPNNPRRRDGTTHLYCPPELVKEEMERLVAWYREYEGRISPEALSAWLHHRFTQIHPFQDGNGRVARTLASLVFIRAGLFPLVIRDKERTEYITALELADAGDLMPLQTIFAKRQRDSILSALGIEQQAKQAAHASEIISAALQVLKDRFKAEKGRIEQVYGIASILWKIAEERMQVLAKQLDTELRPLTPTKSTPYSSSVRSADNNSSDRTFFYNQMVETAREFGYFANIDVYHSWVRLAINTNRRFEYVVSFHGYGAGSTGIMAASAFSALRVPREEGEAGTQIASNRPAATEIFQFNYAESKESIEKRFADWFDSSMAIGLAEWKRHLV